MRQEKQQTDCCNANIYNIANYLVREVALYFPKGVFPVSKPVVSQIPNTSVKLFICKLDSILDC